MSGVERTRREQELPASRRAPSLPTDVEPGIPSADPVARILYLQGTLGNQAVGRLVRRAIQRDTSDQDADQTASAPSQPNYLVSSLSSRPFPWDSEPDPKVPTIALLNRWLDFYNFHERRPLGDERDGVDFNLDFSFNVDNVTNIFMVDSKMAGFGYDTAVVRDGVVANLRPKQTVRARLEKDMANGKAPAPGDTGEPEQPEAKKEEEDSTQIAIAWTFVPKTVHKNLQTGESSSDPPTLQLSGMFTFQLHKDGQRGFELTGGVQASYFTDPGASTPRLQNFSVVAGGEWVTPFFNEFIQLEIVAQVLLGSNYVVGESIGDQFSGPREQTAVQAAAGPQVVFTIPGTNKKLQAFGQVQGSITGAGGAATADASASVGVQWVF